MKVSVIESRCQPAPWAGEMIAMPGFQAPKLAICEQQVAACACRSLRQWLPLGKRKLINACTCTITSYVHLACISDRWSHHCNIKPHVHAISVSSSNISLVGGIISTWARHPGHNLVAAPRWSAGAGAFHPLKAGVGQPQLYVIGATCKCSQRDFLPLPVLSFPVVSFPFLSFPFLSVPSFLSFLLPRASLSLSRARAFALSLSP